MQKRKVNLSTDVALYLSDLAFVLFQKEYFSYIESAMRYVDYVQDTIEKDIHTLKHHSTTDENKRYGTHYVVVRMSRNFAYHVYFVMKGDEYYVTKISSNKLPDAEFLNQF